MNLVQKRTRKEKGEIAFLQNNVGKRQEAHQTLLEIGYLKLVDFILVQEPATWLDKQKKLYFTINHPSYHTITPASLATRPRALVYIRKNLNFAYRLRTNLIEDSDVLALEVHRKNLEKCLIVNLYNKR